MLEPHAFRSFVWAFSAYGEQGYFLVAVVSLAVEHRLWGAWASVVGAHGLSCSVAHGIFLDQGSNPCPLHWQVDSYLLYHQGSPGPVFNNSKGVSETGWSMATPP